MAKKMKFYFPIYAYKADWETEKEQPIKINDLYEERDRIESAVNSYCDEDMLGYWQNWRIHEKLNSMYWGIVAVDEVLYGCVTVELKEGIDETDIDEMDVQEIKDYIDGQNSDGLGEGFEQHSIELTDGTEIYVTFWSSTNDYFILTEKEFKKYIGE